MKMLQKLIALALICTASSALWGMEKAVALRADSKTTAAASQAAHVEQVESKSAAAQASATVYDAWLKVAIPYYKKRSLNGGITMYLVGKQFSLRDDLVLALSSAGLSLEHMGAADLLGENMLKDLCTGVEKVGSVISYLHEKLQEHKIKTAQGASKATEKITQPA